MSSASALAGRSGRTSSSSSRTTKASASRLPLVARTTVPSPAYQQYVLQQLPLGGTDPINGTVLPAQPQEVAFYRNMFALYSNTAGTPTPVLSCPLDANGVLLPGTQTATNLFNGAGCANKRTQSLNNSRQREPDRRQDRPHHQREQQRLVPLPAGHGPAGRLHRPDQPNLQLVFAAAAADACRSATRTSSRRILSINSTPARAGIQASFCPTTTRRCSQIFPIVLAGGSSNAPFTTLGGNDQTYTQGRKVTQWQINDNLIWTRGRHSFKFGENSRRLDVSDYDLGEGVVPT